MKIGYGALASAVAVGVLLGMAETFGGGASPWQWWLYAASVHLCVGLLIAEAGRDAGGGAYGPLAYALVMLLWPFILLWIIIDKRDDNDDDGDGYSADEGADGGAGPSARGGTYRGRPVDRS